MLLKCFSILPSLVLLGFIVSAASILLALLTPVTWYAGMLTLLVFTMTRCLGVPALGQ